MAIKAGKVIVRGSAPADAKKMRRENKPKVKMTANMKSNDKKIRAEDKVKGTRTVNINRPVQTSQSSTREILKPSRYVEDLMR